MNLSTDSVRVVVFDENNLDYFLVLSEIDDPLNFKLPGGKFNNENESPKQACLREIREELGIKLSNINQITELLNDDGHSKRYIFKLISKRESIKPSREISKTIWVTKDSIPECDNHNHILAAMNECLK